MKVALATLGCRANQADGMVLEDGLKARDVQLVPVTEAADVYVINSCTVTMAADADARKLARRFKRRQPAARVIVTGCYAQVAPDELAAIDEVDEVVGNDGKATLVGRILGDEQAASPAPPTPTSRREAGRNWSPRIRAADAVVMDLPESRTRPFLKVQDGCDYSCAFCIIPKARGLSRSVNPDEVLKEALRYAELGARELVLTGIHLGHWGRDLAPRRPFAALIGELADGLAADGRIGRLRLGSVEPNEVSDELLDLVAEHPVLCRHLHLPLQSGDDAVLRRMRRLYRSADFAATVERVYQRMPDAALGVDVLVGHPGEDSDAFGNTRALLGDLPLTYMHVFPYSPRPGTPSATMDDPVHPAERSLRVASLLRLSAQRRLAFHERQTGQRLELLILEEAGERQGVQLLRGLSRRFVPAQLELTEGHGLQRGQVVEAVATAAGGQRITARLATGNDEPRAPLAAQAETP